MGINTTRICITALSIALIAAATALELHDKTALGLWVLVLLLLFGTDWTTRSGGMK